LWGAFVALVVGAMVAIGLVVLLPGDSDNKDDGGQAGRQPATSPTASGAVSTSPATPAPYRCWDGSDAQKLNDCSRPTGVEGLHWLFPHLDDQRCGSPTQTGPGVEQRLLCSARLSDGSRIQLGYYEWASVRTGVDFYDAPQLEPTNGGGFRYWTGRSKGTFKTALMYAAAPFSLTVTVPATAQAATPSDVEALTPRPPKQVRGAPAG
jgi:hypothetical protein